MAPTLKTKEKITGIGVRKGVQKFSLDGDYYDQSTYVGRFLGFIDVIDPQTLFVSDEEITASQQLLKNFSDGSRVVNDDQMWAAKKIVNATIHPSTQEKVSPFFRMASFVPANVPMVAGMLMMPSTGAQLFWQFANQSYNSGLNYANRSGSSVSNKELATNYGMAVGTAMGLAASLKYLAKVGPPMVQKIGAKPWAVPYVSVALSGAANIYFTRRNEIERGVPVTTEDGTEVGISRTAAKQGVFQTIVSRGLFLPLPVLVLPPLLVSGFRRLPGLSNPRLRVPLELGAVTVCLCGALPAAIAAFPQRLELAAKDLEPKFHKYGDVKLFVNKGL